MGGGIKVDASVGWRQKNQWFRISSMEKWMDGGSGGTISDFLDTRNSGMQRLLEEISQHKELPVQQVLRTMASLGVKVVWRALKGLTSGVARVVVQSVEGENGFEAWRRLHHQFEPKLVVKQRQVLSDFAAMVMKPARTMLRPVISSLSWIG